MIKRPAWLLLFCLCSLRALTQGSPAQEGKALLEESKLLRKHQKSAEALAAARSALALLKATGSPGLTGQAWFNLSEQYAGNFADTTIRIRHAYLDSATGPLKTAGNIELLAESYRLMADLDHLVSKMDKALQEANIALRYYESIHYTQMQGIFVLFAKLHYVKGDYPQSLQYGLRALQSAEATKDSGMRLCEITNTIGFTYFKLNEIDNARKYFDLSIGVAEREKDSLTVRMLASNIVECYLKLGQPQKARDFFRTITHNYSVAENKYEMGSYASDKAWFKIYMDLKDYERAGTYVQKLLAITSRNLNKLILSNCYENAIRYFTETHRFDVAEVYLRKNETLLDSLHDLVGMTRNYDQWFTLDTLKGDFRSAALHSNRFNKIKDEVFTQEKNKSIAQLQVEYETEKKEKEIQVERANLRHSNLMRDISFGGAAILAVTGILIYWQFRQKRRAYRAEEQSNNRLRHLLSEKEWLLREIHHRVKNNLQIVLSLLNSQSAYIDNEYALTAIRDSQHRVYAMSLIHQKLYGTENVSSIDMARYIGELVSYLADSYDTWRRIRFDLAIEPLELDVGQAVPLGLVLNEVITNSIKYAFPDERGGVISISLSTAALHRCILTISDNGIGIPPHYEEMRTGSLGMSLIHALTGNLDGTLLIENDNGTTVTISFVREPLVKRAHSLVHPN
jgi:two-component sensor histidine kinase